MFRNTRRCLSQDIAQPRPRDQDSRQNGLQTANFSLDSFDLFDLTKTFKNSSNLQALSVTSKCRQTVLDSPS